MSRETKKAKIKATGKEIEVYKHRERDTWVQYPESENEFKSTELDFK